MCVAAGGHDLKDAVIDSEQGNIEGATTEVEHQNVLFALALVVQAYFFLKKNKGTTTEVRHQNVLFTLAPVVQVYFFL
jgi:hypothetical protein